MLAIRWYARFDGVPDSHPLQASPNATRPTSIPTSSKVKQKQKKSLGTHISNSHALALGTVYVIFNVLRPPWPVRNHHRYH